MLGRIYRRTSCQRKFIATNSDFLQSLPLYIQDAFPAHLTHRAGIDKNLLNFIYGLISDGTSPSLIRNGLKESAYLTYDRARLQYYSLCRDLLLGSESRISNDISLAFSNRQEIIVHKFGAFSAPNGYFEAVPSTKYIISLFRKKHDSLKNWYDNRVSMIPVTHLKIDHSHKVTSRIRLNAVKIFNGLFTAVTENNQIRIQNFAFSKSLDEVSPSLKRLSQTLHARGEPQIKTIATDNCCKDSFILQNSIPDICEQNDAPSSSKSLPYYTLPSDV
jgi:hypothetical protein